jgi:acyl-CoA dehydrogenase
MILAATDAGHGAAPAQGDAVMAIDFEIPAEAKAIRERVRAWVHDECVPAEKALLAGRDYKELLGELRAKARGQGLWCPFIPKEHGGMGLGPLANALVQMELGESYLGALSMNTQGPDDATMMTLLAHGTDYQKEKFLKPLLNGEKRICYSMTEKAAGADATGMRTRAEKDGNENYVLNGEKWFSSAASVADIALVMARTDPDAPRHQQFSTFIVELPDPGYRILRDIPTMGLEGPLSHILGGGHSEIEIKDLIVPAANLLGGEGNGFNMGQHRLAYGRLRHGMHNVAMAQRALDMATARVTERSTFGRKLSERQGVQFMLADCASELYMARLMLLHIAYKAEKGMDLRQENSIAKVFLAHMVHKVVDTAIQLHGALGYSRDTPLAAWYTHIRSQRLVDGPDEVHRWTVGRNVIKAYEAHGTTASAAGGDLL